MILKLCAIIVLFFAGWFYFFRSEKKLDPSFLISTLDYLSQRKSLKMRLLQSKKYFYWTAILFVVLAVFSDESQFLQNSIFPKFYFFTPSKNEPTSIPKKGIAIYFLIDQSSSMKEDVSIYNPKTVHEEEITKNALAKRVTKDFVLGDPLINLKGRQDDLIGLISFARVAHIVCPLTLDKEEFLQRLATIEPVSSEQEDGTAIGYAIFKTVNLIRATKYYATRFENLQKPAYNIENQIIIILTDGLQSPNPLDRSDPFRFMRVGKALQYAEENQVKVYYIGVDPALKQAASSLEMLELKKSIEATGGAFFLADKSESLEAIYNRIDTLEKGEILVSTKEKKIEQKNNLTLLSWQSELALFATFALVLFILLETVIVKKAP